MLQQLVHSLRIGLAGGGFHDLPDKKSEGCCFSGSILRHRVGLFRQHVTDDRQEREVVVDLREPSDVTMSPAVRPDVNIVSNTSLAMDPLMVP